MPSVLLGETLLVAYAQGKRFDYKAAVQRGVYFSSFSHLTLCCLSQMQADSLAHLYGRTRLRDKAYENGAVHPSEALYPRVSRFWRIRRFEPGFYLARAKFSCVSIGYITVRIPNLKYRPRLRGGSMPMQLVKVPAYFITDLISFDSRSTR